VEGLSPPSREYLSATFAFLRETLNFVLDPSNAVIRAACRSVKGTRSPRRRERSDPLHLERQLAPAGGRALGRLPGLCESAGLPNRELRAVFVVFCFFFFLFLFLFFLGFPRGQYPSPPLLRSASHAVQTCKIVSTDVEMHAPIPLSREFPSPQIYLFFAKFF